MAGRPKDVSDSEILKEIALARGPVVTALELADRVGMTGSAVNKRLD
ncbi:MAG: winged helix-turn-helix domain-containing protein, partial [Natronomonas sp.]|nr:winged helix-turn-helix domain-containing protein [Natronomonas sp.]